MHLAAMDQCPFVLARYASAASQPYIAPIEKPVLLITIGHSPCWLIVGDAIDTA